MTDVLKLAEEALEPFESFGKYLADHPRSGVGDTLYGWDNAEEATLRQSDLKRAVAAASAIRAARAEWDWRPIAEMEKDDEFNQATILGRWGLWCGQAPERWCLGNCGHLSVSEAIESGYTHFCRPQLPPPPAREEVGNG